jgi:hypothetical protein
MTAAEQEPTLYEVLEVDPAASLDELRAAVERARENYGPESLAVYALVDEDQLGELRARLDEAAEVLLDPARRARYDRSIGRLGPATLWAEDDDEDEAPLPPVEPGPHAVKAELQLEPASPPEEEEAVAAAPPRQHAFALDIAHTPGPFGQAADRPATAGAGEIAPAAPLLSADWAAAVPAEQQPSRPSVEPAAVASEMAAVAPPSAPEEPAEAPPPAERTGLPPALGLRLKPAAPEETAAPEPLPEPPSPPAPVPSDTHPRSREHRLRLDLPADVEFNGEMLRRVRESYGLSLQQVAERTRITRIHLENVEADRYDRLPATVYLRGILVNLARELRLDPARVSKTYLLAAQRSHARAH